MPVKEVSIMLAIEEARQPQVHCVSSNNNNKNAMPPGVLHFYRNLFLLADAQAQPFII